MFVRFFTYLLICFFGFSGGLVQAGSVDNLRDIDDRVSTTNTANSDLNSFKSGFDNFFFSYGQTGGQGVQSFFIALAFNIKNFFIAIAAIFLVLGVVKLLFGGGDEEALKKWKSNIIYVSVGILIMQFAFVIWKTLLFDDPVQSIGGGIAWGLWTNIFLPLVNFMLLFASLAFLAMAIYAFYTIVTGGGNEEKLKKGRQTILYALIGFVLIRVPKYLVENIYGTAKGCTETFGFTWASGSACSLDTGDRSKVIEIFGTILTYMNGFLFLICVLLVIYAGFLILTSGGDEEKVKKAKGIVKYILIGFILLAASLILFRFFILGDTM